MSVIADSSPLILFAKIGHLALLRQLYGEVLIPPAVRDEVVVQGAGRPGAVDIARATWIRMRPLPPVPPDAQGHRMPAALGGGEREAISLATALGYLLLIDDLGGRRAAQHLGVPVTGSGGVLLAAKQRGLIAAATPLLTALVGAGLHLDEALHAHLLRLSGE